MDSYKFVEGVYFYFVTFTLTDWLPIFISPEPIEIVVDNLKFCITEKSLQVHAYVVMPNHMHLIVSDETFDNERLQKTLTGFRKFTGHKLAGYIDRALLISLSTVTRNSASDDRSRQVWKPGWHAEALASEQFLVQKANYIHENPVRKGLVRSAEDWVHSSACYWTNRESAEIPIAPIVISHM